MYFSVMLYLLGLVGALLVVMTLFSFARAALTRSCPPSPPHVSRLSEATAALLIAESFALHPHSTPTRRPRKHGPDGRFLPHDPS